MSAVQLLRDLRHAAERARAHNLKIDHTLGGPQIAIECPNCRNGQQVIVREDFGKVTGICKRCDLQTLDLNEMLLAPAERSEAAALTRPAEPLKLYAPADLVAMPEPEWLVEPFIPDRSLVVLFGPTGSFKSFIAVDLAGAADGLVVYVSGEGSPRRFGERVVAWERLAGRSANVLVHPYAVDLLGDGEEQLRAALRDVGAPVRMVVVDTTARNIGAADENSTQDMGRFVGVLDRLRAEFECSALVIHHTGHENTDRERGSSALRGAADVSISAKRTETPLEVRLVCKKMRDAAEFEPRIIRLVQQDGSLVVVQAVTRLENLEQQVLDYLAEHPDASQNDVEAAVKGRAADVRDIVRKVRPVRPTAGTHPEGGASHGGVPLRDAPGTLLPGVDAGGEA